MPFGSPFLLLQVSSWPGHLNFNEKFNQDYLFMFRFRFYIWFLIVWIFKLLLEPCLRMLIISMKWGC